MDQYRQNTRHPNALCRALLIWIGAVLEKTVPDKTDIGVGPASWKSS
jgi:hypothetical protein